MTKVDHIHAIDDGVMTDREIAEIVCCHPAYVRCVRDVAKQRSARMLRRINGNDKCRE